MGTSSKAVLGCKFLQKIFKLCSLKLFSRHSALRWLGHKPSTKGRLAARFFLPRHQQALGGAKPLSWIVRAGRATAGRATAGRSGRSGPVHCGPSICIGPPPNHTSNPPPRRGVRRPPDAVGKGRTYASRCIHKHFIEDGSAGF